jgi:hypothetical protein
VTAFSSKDVEVLPRCLPPTHLAFAVRDQFETKPLMFLVQLGDLNHGPPDPHQQFQALHTRHHFDLMDEISRNGGSVLAPHDFAARVSSPRWLRAIRAAKRWWDNVENTH